MAEISGFAYSSSEMCSIRFFSDMNPWIDFITVVPSSHKDKVKSIVDDAFAKYWNDEWGCYGDYVESALNKAKIPFSIFYDSADTDDDSEAQWIEVVKTIKPNQVFIL